jgi:gliding motility-associated protein GldL
MIQGVTKFDKWWNSPRMKRIVGASYSLGASVVILGAMFKILHLPFASVMLGTGMSVESIIFALGVFDKPFKEFDWDKVFEFSENSKLNSLGNIGNSQNNGSMNDNQIQQLNNNNEGKNSDNGFQGASGSGSQRGSGSGSDSGFQGIIYGPGFQGSYTNGDAQNRIEGMPATGSNGIIIPKALDEEDLQKLSEGIKNLSETAKQLSSLTNMVASAESWISNIDSASKATANFANLQANLNGATTQLSNSYQTISNELETVGGNSKDYFLRLEDINKNLSSINSIYEIQLRSVLSQSETIAQNSEHFKTINTELTEFIENVQKIQKGAKEVTIETEKFKNASVKLSKQVSDLNDVYGNMLNALSL